VVTVRVLVVNRGSLKSAAGVSGRCANHYTTRVKSKWIALRTGQCCSNSKGSVTKTSKICLFDRNAL